MNEAQIKFEQAGFKISEFSFNGQVGMAYIKLVNQERTCITNQHELTCPTTLDDPIRVYEIMHNMDNELALQNDFFILNHATDHPTANDYFEWIEHDKNVDVAKRFSSALLNEIGLDNLREVNELNSKETNSHICHSHDFTDANQIMLDIIGNPEDVESIWEEVSPAWTLAKQNNFYINIE